MTLIPSLTAPWQVSQVTEERWLVYTETVQLESDADTEVDAVTELLLGCRHFFLFLLLPCLCLLIV